MDVGVQRRLGPDSDGGDGPVGGRLPPATALLEGGKPPFKFTKRAKAFVVQAGDSCDARQVGVVRKQLPKGSSLQVALGSGGFRVDLKGGFRNPNGNKAPFHLGVTLKQGSRTLLDRKLGAWYQSSFLVADRAGISCWW